MTTALLISNLCFQKTFCFTILSSGSFKSLFKKICADTNLFVYDQFIGYDTNEIAAADHPNDFLVGIHYRYFFKMML